MARTKAMTTHAKELAKSFTPQQLKKLADALAQEAEKPRLDRKEVTRLHREIRGAYVRMKMSEASLSKMLAGIGRTQEQIENELAAIQREAVKDAAAAENKPVRPRGRPRKTI